MNIRIHSASLTALLAVVFALTLVLAGCGQPPGPPGGPPSNAPPEVAFVVVAPKRVTLTTELPGRTTPVLVADVRPQVTGLVQSRRFTEGSEVRAGQLLYQIDPATYAAAVDSAQAAVARAEATVRSSQLKAERYKELVQIDAVSRQDDDDAAATLQQAQADVASSRAAVRTARINLDYTRVTAPIDGRIGRSTVTPGALVTAQQTTALATVQKLDPIYVDVTQSSATVLRLRRALASGQLATGTARVELLMEDGSTYSRRGTLRFSDVTVDQNTGAITLRAEFPNPTGELLPGMYVRAVVEEGVLDTALLVPQPAVGRDNAGKPVAWVVDAENKLQQRSIVTGRAIGDQWLVSSGLAAGDRLAVSGQQKARPGAAVKAVPYAPTQPPAAAASGTTRTVATAADGDGATTAKR